MKVIVIHNYYRSSSPSGEDIVFKNEVELFKKNGIDVLTYEKHNDDIERGSKLKTAFTTIWSGRTYKALKNLLKKEKPDIAHFHNIWYLISPSAYYACKDAGIPVVQTLHNFRMFCVNGLLMREDRICEECIGRLPWRGVKYGCYRNSKLYSLPVALTEGIHSIARTWEDKVDAYIALTEFGKKRVIECGLPSEKIFVKPNFLPDPPAPNFLNHGYTVFLGRLSVEKGVNVLINAFNILHFSSTYQASLKIVGEGPLKDNLESIVKAGKLNSIEFTGRKSFKECVKLMQGAKFMIMPSLWYEGFPMTIREAFACGKAVIASRLGAMAELIEDGKTGLLFEPGNPDDLADKIKWMIENEDACVEMGKNARKEFEEKYTAEKNYQMLMKIYQSVLNKNKS
jgi:glycosyltransferase involved in cell wall biosynthesis